MPKLTVTVDHPLNGGQDNSNADFRGTEGSFNQLLNFRPERGKLVQTSRIGYVEELTDFDALGSEDVLMMEQLQDKYIVLTRNTAHAWSEAALDDPIPYIEQNMTVTAVGEEKNMLLYSLNATDFVLEGDAFEVQVVTAGSDVLTPATIKWRKNTTLGGSGTWSSATNLVNGMTIGSGLKLAVRITYGWTALDTFEWEYKPWPIDVNKYHHPRVTYRDDVYIGGPSNKIMRYRETVADEPFITQVGYRPVYGKYPKIFSNHLVIGQFTQGSGATLDDSSSNRAVRFTVGWSDLDDPDNFFSTDINEADTYVLPYAGGADLAWLGMTGMEQYGEYLYIYTPTQIFVMMYLGLPLVMRIVNVTDMVGNIAQNGLVSTPYGHFFIGRNDFFFFNPTEGLPQAIGAPIRDAFFEDTYMSIGAWNTRCFGYYDVDRKEVVWTYLTRGGVNTRQVVYKIEERLWFFREIPTIFCSAPTFTNESPQRYYGFSNAEVHADDMTGATYDTHTEELATTAFAVPTVIKHQTVYGDPTINKVLQNVFLDASWHTCSGLKLETSVVDFANATPSYVAADAVWTSSKAEKRLTVRLKGRIFQSKLTATGTEAINVTVNRWTDSVEIQGAPTT